MPLPVRDAGSELLEAFERRLRADPSADLTEFMLPPDHPDHLAELTELVRLDMEYASRRGAPRPPDHYFASFPALRASATARAALAFEDYRLRRLGGEPVTPDDYAHRYKVATSGWPTDPSADREEPDPILNSGTMTPLPGARIEHLRTAIVNIDPARPPAFPEVGTRFLGFELVEELGSGTFGRVYLARQGALASRPVALKVGRGLFAETQTLAQLQHTNIVPIHSAHETGGWQALCMPYFGRCTLAHVLDAIRAGGVPTTGQQFVGTVLLGRTATRPGSGSGVNRATPAPERERPAPVAARERSAGAQPWGKLAALSYPEAVVWVGALLAAGLAHAHDRGIIHRDLKPANVLLTDDGVPMLLDFNIAEDAKAIDRTPRAIGGTFPYMAPEQLRAYSLGTAAPLDGRADVYALGVVLFEMLTGARPFPNRVGEFQQSIRAMMDDRAATAPGIRSLNPLVSPAVASIVAKCLAANPDERYSARDLHEDLTRHLNHLPLAHTPERSLRERFGKWRKRHPRLTSASAVGALAAVLLAATVGGAFVTRERSRAFEARVALTDHARDINALQVLLDDRNQTRESLDRGIELCRTALDRYDIPTGATEARADWDRSRFIRYLPADDRAVLRDDFGEVFYLMAKAAGRRAELAHEQAERDGHLADATRWNSRAAEYGSDRIPRAVRAQRADLERLGGRAAEADRLLAEASRTPPASARDRYLLGYWHHHQGRFRQAAEELAAATAAEPSNFSAWFVRGTNHLALEQNDLAAMCFTACVALRADFAPVWVNRGIALARLRKFDLALADYTEADRLAPNSADVHILRGGVLQAQGKFRDAADAFTSALNAPNCSTRVYSYRANCRRQTGDATGAAADEAEALKREPTDELSWTARAEARLRARDPRAALADVESALRVNPRSLPALQLKAHVLAERLGDSAGAIRSLDRAVELYPDSVPARAGRAVLLARAGERDRAHRDAELALQLDTGGPNLYQVGCVYALTAKAHPADRFRACELIAAALRAGFGREYLTNDTDLDPIRSSPEFRKLTAPQ